MDNVCINEEEVGAVAKCFFTADDCPVYVNEDGEWVTDLAYRYSLGATADQFSNPFDRDFLASAAVMDDVNLETAYGTDDEFKSAGKMPFH